MWIWVYTYNSVVEWGCYKVLQRLLKGWQPTGKLWWYPELVIFWFGDILIWWYISLVISWFCDILILIWIFWDGYFHVFCRYFSFVYGTQWFGGGKMWKTDTESNCQPLAYHTHLSLKVLHFSAGEVLLQILLKGWSLWRNQKIDLYRNQEYLAQNQTIRLFGMFLSPSIWSGFANFDIYQ